MGEAAGFTRILAMEGHTTMSEDRTLGDLLKEFGMEDTTLPPTKEEELYQKVMCGKDPQFFSIRYLWQGFRGTLRFLERDGMFLMRDGINGHTRVKIEDVFKSWVAEWLLSRYGGRISAGTDLDKVVGMITAHEDVQKLLKATPVD